MSPHKKNHSFYPNQPVSGDQFFGRANELPHVIDRLLDNQSVLITGERRIGKSSLLLQTQNLVSAQNAETEDHYLDAFEVHHLKDALVPIIGRKAAARELQTILRNRDKRIRLFINDLDSIIAAQLEAERDRAAATIRGLIDSGHVVIAAVSYHPHLSIETSSDREQFFNVFTQCPLRGFTKSEAEEFLSKSSAQSGEKLAPNEIALIIDLFGTIPSHLQEYGYTLFTSTPFTGSSGGQRLDCFYQAASAATERISMLWAERLSETWNESTVQAVFEIARGEKATDVGATRWLVSRGILDEGKEPFASMGRVFLEFIQSLQPVKPVSHKGREFAGRLAEGTLRTVIDALVKAHLPTT